MHKKFCPKCKSRNVGLKITALSGAMGEIPDWECLDCGFRTKMFPNEKELRKKK